MTDHVARLYAVSATFAAFFLAWAGIAARPWQEPAADPRLAALAEREQRLSRDAVLVKRVVDRRFAAYRAALARRQAANARAAPAGTASAGTPAVAQAALKPVARPSARIVSLPPVATTRSS